MANFLRSLIPAFLAGIGAGAFLYIAARVAENVNVLAIDPYVAAVLGFSCAAGIYIFENAVKKQ